MFRAAQLIRSSPREVVQKLYEGFQKSDKAAVGKALAGCRVQYGPKDACGLHRAIPFAGTFLDGSDFAEAVFTNAKFQSLTADPILVDGNRFAAHIRAELTAPGLTEPFTTESIHIGEVKNGKLSSLNIQADTFTLARVYEQLKAAAAKN